MEKIRVSKWCSVYEQNDISALLHSLSLFVIYLPKEVGKFIEDMKKQDNSVDISNLEVFLGKDLLKVLMQEKLLLPINHNETKEAFLMGEKIKKQQPLNMMYLLLTDGCNFKCRYCFEEVSCPKEKFISLNMTKETALSAIKKFTQLRNRYGDNRLTTIINLYGGEPLLNKPIVYFSIKKIKSMVISGQLPENTQIILTTNGSLMSKELAKFIAQNNVSVGLSIDGPIEFNDKYRLAKNGQSAFQLAYNAYKILKENNINVGISFTITPEILSHQDDIIDFLLNKLNIKEGMGFNILHYNAHIKPDKDYYINAAKFILKAFEIFRKLDIYEDRIMRKVKAFSSRNVIFADCGIIGNQIVVSPEGKIGICQDFIKSRTYFLGDVFDVDYDPVKNGLYNGWTYRSPLFTKECQNCPAISICGGGCPASVELETGNRWNVDERFCPHSKLTLEWLIWDTYFNISNRVVI